MVSLLLATLLLGVAGIDPIGATLLASGIAVGISRAKIIIFVSCVFIFTVLTGVLLSIAGSRIIADISSAIPESNSSFWAFINIIIATIICVWLYRKLKTSSSKKPKKKLIGSTWVIALVGIAFGVSAVLDPTFLAVVSITSQNGNLLTIGAMHMIWVLVSQIMLFSLFFAYLFSKHEVILNKSRHYWKKHSALLNRILFAVAILCVIILFVDTLAFVFNGTYIIIF